MQNTVIFHRKRKTKRGRWQTDEEVVLTLKVRWVCCSLARPLLHVQNSSHLKVMDTISKEVPQE